MADGVPRFATVGEPGDGRYWITGVTDDFDHDGRVDLFLVEWEPSLPSLLFRNTGGGGPWVAVDVDDLGASVTGARVEARVDGEPVATGWATGTTGYAAGVPLVVHLGLGDAGAAATEVEVTVTPVPGDPRTLRVAPGSHTARCVLTAIDAAGEPAAILSPAEIPPGRVRKQAEVRSSERRA